ncbi:uncharacterized protein B0H18DRAFT_968230 [Fomitopsis serialis]|uniref:uncharacterized protein n=1 Tax=Fomitopsis serialis TaxID=139415 RepID=UPI0020074F97|nr:uncharacterized protein B0H18DRAFT_968230 [Neoantrodia serialis]KAH9938668.1 hypothetical protein B0H18DRAFT_968230 [Neoantrodia serialis]
MRSLNSLSRYFSASLAIRTKSPTMSEVGAHDLRNDLKDGCSGDAALVINLPEAPVVLRSIPARRAAQDQQAI